MKEGQLEENMSETKENREERRRGKGKAGKE